MSCWACGKGFCSLGIRRHSKNNLCRGPIGSDQIDALRCSSTKIGDSHHPMSRAGCWECAACTVLVAGVGRGRWGEKCNGSLNFPCKPKPLPHAHPSPRGHHKQGHLYKDHWFSEMHIHQWAAGWCFRESWLWFLTTASQQEYLISLCNLGWCFLLWKLHFMLRNFQAADQEIWTFLNLFIRMTAVGMLK